jgi:hypothetical protein
MQIRKRNFELFGKFELFELFRIFELFDMSTDNKINLTLLLLDLWSTLPTLAPDTDLQPFHGWPVAVQAACGCLNTPLHTPCHASPVILIP